MIHRYKWSIFIKIIALLVIFLPMLLTYRSYYLSADKLASRDMIFSEYRPQFAHTRVIPLSLAKLIHSQPALLSVATAFAPLKQGSALATASKPQAWVVQLGSFNNADSATALSRQLRMAKVSVFRYRQHGKIAVAAGPVLTFAEAKQLLQQVKLKTARQGKVVPFDSQKFLPIFSKEGTS